MPASGGLFYILAPFKIPLAGGISYKIKKGQLNCPLSLHSLLLLTCKIIIPLLVKQ